jgi:hypothetical protein
MYKCLATVTGTVAILAATLLASGRVEARGSPVAPSKYAHANKVSDRTHRQVQRTDFGITEYSSSSAKSSVPKR